MEPSDGAGGADRLSALPDDVLVHILLKLRNASVAAQTSVLARRWRRVWALVPDLHFPVGTDPHRIRPAVAAHHAPALRHLIVATADATPESIAGWLPIAARRLFGELRLKNSTLLPHMDEASSAEKRGAIELPCFQNATKILLDLPSLGLTLPPSGVFARLTDLWLFAVQLHGPYELGDVVSSPRCPSLRSLFVWNCRGLDKLTIHSESLLRMGLRGLSALQQLTVVAPALSELLVLFTNAQVTNIAAPRLVTLEWGSNYDPGSVQFGEMTLLQELITCSFFVYVSGEDANICRCLRLLQRFHHISRLSLTLIYLPVRLLPVTGNLPFWLEKMTDLPNITILRLNVMACGHSFGPSLFHVLRLSGGIRELVVKLVDTPSHIEALAACQSGCFCEQPSNWKTDELVLNCLEKVEIRSFRGTENEVTFVKSFLGWATVLKRMTVNFHDLVTESKGKELLELLGSFSRPEVRMKFAQSTSVEVEISNLFQ